MKFGIRDVCEVNFHLISGIGPKSFTIDTAKMSTLEGATTTVYAQGGSGNARLLAWEGEKTITFTVEDALLTLASFHALTGAERTEGNGKTRFSIKSTSFAGYYRVTATTLFRNENGVDVSAFIEIPKVKLQTTLNLAMAASGDPSTFTFTMDAFPGGEDGKTLFSLEIDAVDSPENIEGKTVVHIIDNTGKTSSVDTLETITPDPFLQLIVDKDNNSTITLEDGTSVVKEQKTGVLTTGTQEFRQKILETGHTYYIEFIEKDA